MGELLIAFATLVIIGLYLPDSGSMTGKGVHVTNPGDRLKSRAILSSTRIFPEAVCTPSEELIAELAESFVYMDR